jgi:hypothetical protein
VWRASCAWANATPVAADVAAGTAHIDLDDGETLGCAFTLAPARGATLTIRHEATPADDQDFAYTGDFGPFLLRAPSAAQMSFSPPPGRYRVHELRHPLWTLGSLTCEGTLTAADRGA